MFDLGLRAAAGRLGGLSARRVLDWVLRRIVDGEFRESARLRARPPAGLFQPWGYTEPGRYPRLFAGIGELLPAAPDLLSFGCASGDEIYTLDQRFAPRSILGVDISARRIAICRRRVRREPPRAQVRFEVAGSAETLSPASFDAVFALAVFRHGDLRAAPPRCDHLVRFADFERTVTGLARCVRPGGLLVLRHAQFRFADTAIAAEFDPVLSVRTTGTRCYGPDNCLMPEAEVETVAFRRR